MALCRAEPRIGIFMRLALPLAVVAARLSACSWSPPPPQLAGAETQTQTQMQTQPPPPSAAPPPRAAVTAQPDMVAPNYPVDAAPLPQMSRGSAAGGAGGSIARAPVPSIIAGQAYEEPQLMTPGPPGERGYSSA